jgi:hypothetical protein
MGQSLKWEFARETEVLGENLTPLSNLFTTNPTLPDLRPNPAVNSFRKSVATFKTKPFSRSSEAVMRRVLGPGMRHHKITDFLEERPAPLFRFKDASVARVWRHVTMCTT